MKIERNILFSCTDLPEKEKRNLAIFELIRTKGLISKPEISKATGINIVSVSNYIENYITRKLISERESEVSSGGRKPELVELNRSGRFVAGVDIGRGGISAAVTDLSGKPVVTSGLVKARTDNVAALSSSVASAVRETAKKAGAGSEGLGAVGIAMADKTFIPVGEALTKDLDVDIFAGGAAQCAAFGERMFNTAVNNDEILYMHSDLGRGIVLKGCRCFGAVGSPAEIEVVMADGSDDDDDLSDELQYLRPWDAALGVVQAAKAQVARGVGTKIVGSARGSVDNISVETVIAAARQKDRVASDILRTVGLNLGVRIAYLINLFGPTTVVIGGGIDKAGELILDPIRLMVKRFSCAKQAKRVRILAGSLGDDAACLGAAALAVREMFVRA